MLANSLHGVLNDIRDNYIYLSDKNVDIECIRNSYLRKLDEIKTRDDLVLFFEYLMDEFYDDHLILNTNIKASYRLHAPIYTKTENGKTTITNIWYSQIKNLEKNILGAEIIEFNGKKFSDAIDAFPTICHDKANTEVRQWIANKVLAGKYNEPRILKLKLLNGHIEKVDLDDFKIIKTRNVLSSSKIDNIGIIRINNSLANYSLVPKFDKALNSFMDTEGLIIDLRNTINGGRCDIAASIIGRFIDKELVYQKVVPSERPDDYLQPKQSCIYVQPRYKRYDKPVVILVGRWTGSMGEGIAMGFDGLERAEVVGTEMRKLLGNMYGYSIKGTDIKFNISREKVYDLSGVSRQDYIPKYYINQSQIRADIVLKKGIDLIKK